MNHAAVAQKPAKKAPAANASVTRNETKQSHLIIEMIECYQNAKVSTTVIKQSDKSVDIVSFRTDEDKVIESSLFDTYAMVIEGQLFLKINGVSTMIHAGESKVLPAFNSYYINSKHPFKVMLTTVIKGGY
jgi:mannose-6-phosphate isomerase-like protein (cupin superfamily)